MKVKLLCCALLAALVGVAAAESATQPLVAKALGVGTLKAPISVDATAGVMALESIRVAPGGDFGWHTHGAPVAVVIRSGTLTVWDPTVANCAPQHYGKGAAFIEPAGHLHRARNEGRAPVLLYAMYLGIPKGVQPNQPGTAPGGCTQ
jgi:quercetin dioxygenase-like cupin family protein